MKLTKGLTRHKKQLYKYICMYIEIFQNFLVGAHQESAQ